MSDLGVNNSRPLAILICTEGKKTEPQYFDFVISRMRISEKIEIKVIGDLNQHIRLIKESAIARAAVAEKYEISEEDIETWAVCDKDDMQCNLKELKNYAKMNNIRLAFSDPNFEIFLLQHFKKSATNGTNKEIQMLISKELASRKLGKYDKTNLSNILHVIDENPACLKFAIANCNLMSDEESTPYVTVHNLLARLLEWAVK